MSALAEIIEGWTNLTKLQFGSVPEHLQKMGEERSAICIDCKAYNKGFCDPKRSVQHKTKNEMVTGCGCYLAAKVLCEKCKCPAGKW